MVVLQYRPIGTDQHVTLYFNQSILSKINIRCTKTI